jgi:predicted transcriptional regulator
MLTPELTVRALRAAEVCRSLGITQGEIAEALGASQSQVSRILQAKARRASRLFEEVCLYVERHGGGITADAVRANEELIGALQSTWDGSAAHARALSAVIRSLGVLGSAQVSMHSEARGSEAC